MDDQTIYKLSFWDGPVSVRSEQAARPPDSLTVGEGPISDETVHKVEKDCSLFKKSITLEIDNKLRSCDEFFTFE